MNRADELAESVGESIAASPFYSLFMNFGRRYTLTLYNSPVNVIADLILVLSLLVVARMPFHSRVRHIELIEAMERPLK